MAISGKYRVIEAQTLEECKYHRRLIEQALQDGAMSPALHAELTNKLNHVIAAENAILEQKGADEEQDSGDGDGGDGGQEGRGGNSSGSGGSGGGDSGGIVMQNQEPETQDKDLDELETVALLFFLTENDIDRPMAPSPDVDMGFGAAAAATLLFNRRDGTAQLVEASMLDHPNGKQAIPDIMPSLERHIARMGANFMQLRVQPDAVDTFNKKLGYKAVGKISSRMGKPTQKMSKNLSGPQIIPPSD